MLTVLALAYMGFLVSRNSRQRTNQLFLVFVLSDALWLTSVFLINNTNLGTNKLLARLVFAFALLLIMAIHGFTTALLGNVRTNLFKIFVYAAGIGTFLLTAFTPLVIKGVTTNPDANGNLSPFPAYGTLYLVFLVYVVVAILIILALLVRMGWALRGTSSFKRRQLNIVATGLIAFTIVSVLTNLVLPEVFSAPWPSQFAPLGSLILTASFYYAINRYRLFDIRVAVVRSTTYLFLVISLALVYVAGASLVTALGAGGPAEELFNVLVVLFIAVSFQPLKHGFDRATNRYFFQDSYNTKDVVDSLNSILISSFDLDKLTQACQDLLRDKLKLDFCALLVLAQADDHKIIGQHKGLFTVRQYELLDGSFAQLQHKVITERDALQDGRELQGLYKDKNMSAVAKMATGNQNLGYIVLGKKKNDKDLSPQDIGVLNIAADQIAIASQNVMRFEEIQNFNATLQQQIENATGQLKRTNEKLRQMDETKDDFISMASHQLRTPLTSVKGYLSMVLEGDAGRVDPKQKKLLNQAFISSERMVYLIADLLNVSRLKTGKFIIEATPINLADIINSEVGQLTETAGARGLRLKFERPKHFPTLMMDETKIRQVIMNFIDNAIYYTQSGGHIIVKLEENQQTVSLKVVDDGIGVPKHEQPHLFTKFFRAGNARKARPDGTGLGLFMAKKVIIAQGGSIVFRSHEGKGSIFGFTFAKAKLTPPVSPGEHHVEEMLSEQPQSS